MYTYVTQTYYRMPNLPPVHRYTVLDHGNNNGTPASSSSSGGRNRKIAAALGGAVSGFAVIAGIMVWMWVRRTRKRKNIPPKIVKRSPPPTTPPPPPSPPPIMVTQISPLPTRPVGMPPRNSQGQRPRPPPPPPPPPPHPPQYQPPGASLRSLTPPTCTSPAPSSIYTVPPDFGWQVPNSRDPNELRDWMRAPTRR